MDALGIVVSLRELVCKLPLFRLCVAVLLSLLVLVYVHKLVHVALVLLLEISARVALIDAALQILGSQQPRACDLAVVLLRSAIALASVVRWTCKLHLLFLMFREASIWVLLVVHMIALCQVLLAWLTIVYMDVGLVAAFVHDVNVVGVTLVVAALRLEVVLALVHEDLLLQLAV